MKTILFNFLFILICINLNSQITYTSTGDGNWNSPSNWSTVPAGQGSPGATPPANSIIIVNHDLTLNGGNFVLNQGNVDITVNSTGSININNNLAFAGNSSSISGDGSVTVGGNLNINNGSGHVLDINTTVNGTLNTQSNVGLTAGNLSIAQNVNLNNQNVSLVTSAFSVGGNLSLNGQVSLVTNGPVDVDGALSIMGQPNLIMFNDLLTVDGNVNTNTNRDIFIESAIFNSDLNFDGQGDIIILNDLTVNGNGNVRFRTNGSIDIGGNVSLGTGNVTIENQLEFDIDGDFSTMGNLTLSGGGTELNIAGASTIDGDLTLSGQADIVFGTNTNITGNVSAQGSGTDITLGNGNTNVDGIINIGSQANINGTAGGILSFGSINVNSNARILCTAANLDDNDMIPNPLDLSTCGASALPITLGFFEVDLVKGNLFFQWQTLSEENNDFFTIEYSYDAENFNILADQINGAGNSSAAIDYNYIDNSFFPSDEVIFFRLKQTDFDGTFTFSPIISINNDTEFDPETFTFYPNPAKDLLTLILPTNNSEESYSVSIINSISLNNERTFFIESNEAELEISDLAPGLYFITIDGINLAQKLIIY